MIKRGSDTLLFDCGEGAQQQMMRARTGFLVDAIFITHWHADHFLGILGLIQTLSFMGREEPLPIYGPEWVHDCVTAIRQISVRAFNTIHGLPSLGYILEEDCRPGRFNREEAVLLGVPPGPLFGRLQRGETVCIVKEGSGIDIKPEDVMGPPRPGRKIVYTGDTRPIQNRIADIARNADLLIHDCTYDDHELERACEVYHSTAGEAGDVARHLNVKTLALVHISSRYTSTATHIRDAKKRFEGNVIAPSDLDMIEIPFRDE
jgi:ribonuclease Z